jgi:hypothetical protein
MASRIRDGCEKSRILQRLQQISGHTCSLAASLQVAVLMRRDDDSVDFHAPSYEVLMQLKAIHLGHLQVDYQTLRLPLGQKGDELLRGCECLRVESACA